MFRGHSFVFTSRNSMVRHQTPRSWRLQNSTSSIPPELCSHFVFKVRIKTLVFPNNENSYHFALSFHINSYRFISFHIVSHHFISFHIGSYEISYHFISFHTISYYFILFHHIHWFVAPRFSQCFPLHFSLQWTHWGSCHANTCKGAVSHLFFNFAKEGVLLQSNSKFQHTLR